MSGAGEGLGRRDVVLGAVACCLLTSAPAAAEDGSLPVKGDHLIIDSGANEGKPVTVDNVTAGGGLVFAVPADPATGAKRTGSRFSKILLVRLAPEDVQEEYRPHAVDGIVALSAICTHQGCTISAWSPETKHLTCFCHHSEFIPGEGGEVAHGPARKRLPVLPISKGDGGALIVAGEFLGKPGPGPA